jgi:hypothetical protein
MQPRHRSHLRSTQSTIREHLAAIRQVVTSGESPGGGRSAPLPPNQREPLLAVLDRLEASLAEVMQALAPERTRASGEPREAAGARMWASILLRTVAELVRDLSPEVMGRRYGAADPAAAAALREAVPRLLREIGHGLDLLNGQ